MISTLGPVALAAGFGGAITACALWVLTARGSEARRGPARGLTLLTLVSALTSAVLMEWALVGNDFSVRYVAENSGRAVPLYYRVTGLWAALEGSLLLWLVVLTGYAVALGRSRRTAPRLHDWAMAVLTSVVAFFFGLALSTGSAFDRVNPVPLDGPGPNPLLQDHPLMAVHPPLLYIGYVGLGIPFAFAVAALITGNTGPGWLTTLRGWTLFAWVSLTAGILLGMWWAYAVLGWGGYWAWDPVENASVLPWFTATALLHSVMVQERRSILQIWNITLAAATFVLVLIGTFLTRSGVVASVHAFTQSPLGPVLLTYIAVVVLAVVALFIWRADRLGPVGRIEVVGSREAVFLVNNVLFVALAVTVLLGTTFPLLMESLHGTQVSVGAPYFNRLTVPIALVIVVLMGVGPLVPWGGGAARDLRRRLLPALVAGLAGIAAGGLVGQAGVRLVLAYGAVAAATAGLLSVLARDAAAVHRRGLSWPRSVARSVVGNRRRYGGILVHAGVLVAVVAIAVSSALVSTREATLAVGESVSVGGYTATLKEIRGERTPRFMQVQVVTELSKGSRTLGERTPALRFYPSMNEAIGRPAIHSGPLADAYLTVASVSGDRSTAHVRVTVTPLMLWLWLSGLVIAAGALLAGLPTAAQRRSRRKQAQGDATETEPDELPELVAGRT